jgi:hypothetical protein
VLSGHILGLGFIVQRYDWTDTFFYS